MAHAIVMPSYGMYTAEGSLARWVVHSGAAVEAGDVVAEIETEKALADVTAPASGILHQVAEPGAQLEVESLIGYVLAPDEAAPEPETPELGPSADAEPLRGPPPERTALRARGEAFASPNARRLAAELGVDLAGLTGTGPGGRIGEADVRAAHGRSSP